MTAETDMRDTSRGDVSASLQVNFDRLRDEILALAEIGRDDQAGGLYRMAFTPADMEGRRWLADRIEKAGLEAITDGAANLGTRYGGEPNEPVVMVGSHIDTVPNAGYLDGTLGVLIGLEAIRRMKEAGVKTRRPVELISFSDEEGRFGGLFGSQAVAGEINPETVRTARDLNGVSLVDAMSECGYEAMAALNARRDRATIHSYIELHIEQGPVLDQKQIPVGVVENITGLFKWSVRLEGVPNHAGTTPMEMRRDPFMGLAEFAGEVPRILEENGSDLSRATIGRVDLFPGAANTVPGEVVFSMDVRDTSSEVMEQLAGAFRKALSAIARRRGLKFGFDVLSEVEPAPCDPEIVGIIERQAGIRGLKSLRMPSGAAHDAQIMSRIAPIGMVFVPSKDGRSHSPAEWTAWEDIEAGANVMLGTLLELAGSR